MFRFMVGNCYTYYRWFGDIYPITVAGRILGGIVSFLGIGLVAVPSGIISSGFIEYSAREKEKERMEKGTTDLNAELDKLKNQIEIIQNIIKEEDQKKS